MRRHLEIGGHEAIVLWPIDAQHDAYPLRRGGISALTRVIGLDAVHDNGVTAHRICVMATGREKTSGRPLVRELGNA